MGSIGGSPQTIRGIRLGLAFRSFHFRSTSHTVLLENAMVIERCFVLIESYYVQMTSCQQVFPLDRLLCVTQGDLVLMCPVTSLPTHSWKVVSLHSFGTSGPQLWLQQCKGCNQETASDPVFLTIGSGASACEEIFEQVCAVACGTGSQDKNVLSQSDTVTGHTKTFYLAAHQGHEQHSPSPTPQHGQAVFLNRALSPDTLATNTSVSDDKWSSRSVSCDHPDSGFSTRSNSGVLTTAMPPILHHHHESAVRQGSLPISSHHRPTRSRLQKGSLPLLDYPVSSASCGSLDAYKRSTDYGDEPLGPHYDNRDTEDVFVFMTCPASQFPPSKKLVTARSHSDAWPQMMKNTKILTTARTHSHLIIGSTAARQHPPPSPPIPPRPAKTLVPSTIPKRKCPSE